MQMRQRQKYLRQAWLGNIATQVTYAAVDLLAHEHRYAAAALPSRDYELVPLNPCRHKFTQQYGLPCRHTILARLEASEPLTKEDCLPRWWLVKPLVSPPRDTARILANRHL